MGIPTYFKYLLEKFSDEIIVTSDNIDFFYIDFNSIIYNCFYENPSHFSQINNRKLFHNHILQKTLSLCKVVNPRKEVFIAWDGSIPVAKVHQQRSRRYKAQYESFVLKKTSEDNNISHYACPGTEFMYELSLLFQSKINWMRDNLEHCPRIIISTSEQFGEGEHKILSRIKETDLNDTTIGVFSPDNDLLSLLALLNLNNTNIYLLRFMDIMIASLLDKDIEPDKVIYISINMISSKFIEEEKEPQFHSQSLLLDYNFLLSIVGNDFVVSHPYLKIKSKGFDKLLKIYKGIRMKRNNEFLIDRETFHVNDSFFLDIIRELVLRENQEFYSFHSFLQFQKTHPDNRIDDKEELSVMKKEEQKLQHLYMCNPKHPLYSMYKKTFFQTIDFRLSKFDPVQFRKQYYSHFLWEKEKNEDNVKEMVMEYLKSLKFTLLYYNKKCPCFHYYYKFRSAPLFSDVLYYLESGLININELDFKEASKKPISPLMQLFLILPTSVLKKTIEPEFTRVIDKYKNRNESPNINVEALVGLKFIYSESILDNFKNISSISFELNRVLSKLPDYKKERYRFKACV